MARLASMTGYAHRAGSDERYAWHWELRSFNSRTLDLRLRLATGWDMLEPLLREKVSAALKRGSLQVSLSVRAAPDAPLPFRIDHTVLRSMVATLKEVAGEIEAAPPRLDSLLGLPGVLVLGAEAEEEESLKARQARLLEDFAAALAELAGAREQEGAQLGAVLAGHLDSIERLTAAAAASEAARPQAFRARLAAQLAELLAAQPALSEERLAQEAALLATKADVREELDRLAAHVAAARELLAAGGPVGRKLDFLCQEFNREANTLCSKSADIALTRIGLELKSTIEQLREQVQNLE